MTEEEAKTQQCIGPRNCGQIVNTGSLNPDDRRVCVGSACKMAWRWERVPPAPGVYSSAYVPSRRLLRTGRPAMIGKWLERRRTRAAAEKAEDEAAARSRDEWRQRERRDNDARALANMREAFEPLTEEERREITLRVAMDTKLRGNSDGTYSEEASRYGDCAYMANNLVRMREALKS